MPIRPIHHRRNAEAMGHSGTGVQVSVGFFYTQHDRLRRKSRILLFQHPKNQQQSLQA